MIHASEIEDEAPLTLRELASHLRYARGSDQAKEAAKAFIGKPLQNLETGITAVVSKSSFAKILSQSSVRNSVSQQAHHQAAANVDRLFELATHGRSKPDRGNDTNIKSIHHLNVPMPFGDEILEVSMMVKELANPQHGNILYTLAAVKIEEPSSFRGDAGVSIAQDRLPTPPEGYAEKFAAMIAKVKLGMGQPMTLALRHPAASTTHKPDYGCVAGKAQHAA